MWHSDCLGRDVLIVRRRERGRDRKNKGERGRER